MTRRIEFEGIGNFRDFGGYATVCGRGVKRGVLYRSAHHAHATDEDLAAMRALGITAIVDLRRPNERNYQPSRRWPGWAGKVIENDLDQDFDWVQSLIDSDLSARHFFEDGVAYYHKAPFEERMLDLLQRWFRLLADADGPVLVHCAAGKDRTGITCALTHHIAGVHRDDIFEDFLATNDERHFQRRGPDLAKAIFEATGRHVDEQALRVAMGVHADYLDAAWKTMEAGHGSIDGYLEGALGVDAALRARIAANILG
jgi:protein-tyrosine phosphatase